jgi:competence protein ComGC
MDWFQRIGLPIILVIVAVITVLLVLNAFEATELMQEQGRAAPTLLNPSQR